MRTALALAAAVSGLLGAPAGAQGVPAGQHIVSLFQNATSTTSGLLLIDRASSTCKPVTGLANAEVNTVQLDPVDETVWIGDLTGAGLRRITIDASCNVASEQVWGMATTTASTTDAITGITFDNDGNPLVASGNLSLGGGIWRFDRSAPGNAVNISGTGPNGDANCIARDSAGNVYFGVTGLQGGLFVMPATADCQYASPMFLGPITPASNSTTITGLDICERTNTLWWTSFGTSGTSFGSFPLPGGPAATSTSSTLPGLNDLEYDVRRDDFTAVSSGPDPDTVFAVDQSFGASTVCLLPPAGANGVPSGVDASDCLDGDLLVAPSCVRGNVPFTLELAACCPPGWLGGIAITAPSTGVVMVATAPPSGRIVAPAFGGLVLPPGTKAGALTFVAACVDPMTNQVRVGPPVPWPAVDVP